MGNHHSGRHRRDDDYEDDDQFYYSVGGRLPSPFNKAPQDHRQLPQHPQQQALHQNGGYHPQSQQTLKPQGINGSAPAPLNGDQATRLIKPPSGQHLRGQHGMANGVHAKPGSSNSSRSTSPTNHPSFTGIPTPRSLQNTPNVAAKHQNDNRNGSGLPARGCMIPGRSSLRLPSNGSGPSGSQKAAKHADACEDEPKMKSKGSSVFDKLNVFHRDKSERSSGRGSAIGSGTGKRTSSSSGFSSAQSQSDSSSVDRQSGIATAAPQYSPLRKGGNKSTSSPKLRKRSDATENATPSLTRADAGRRSSRGSRMPVPVPIPVPNVAANVPNPVPNGVHPGIHESAAKPTAAVKATPLTEPNMNVVPRPNPDKEIKEKTVEIAVEEKPCPNVALVSPMLNRRVGEPASQRIPSPPILDAEKKAPVIQDREPMTTNEITLGPVSSMAAHASSSTSGAEAVPAPAPAKLPTLVTEGMNDECLPEDEVMDVRPMAPVRTTNLSFLRGFTRASASAVGSNSPFEAFLKKRMNGPGAVADPGPGYMSDSEATGYGGVSAADNFDGYMSEGGAGLHAASKRLKPVAPAGYPPTVAEDACRLPSSLPGYRPSTTGMIGRSRPSYKRPDDLSSVSSTGTSGASYASPPGIVQDDSSMMSSSSDSYRVGSKHADGRFSRGLSEGPYAAPVQPHRGPAEGAIDPQTLAAMHHHHQQQQQLQQQQQQQQMQQYRVISARPSSSSSSKTSKKTDSSQQTEYTAFTRQDAHRRSAQEKYNIPSSSSRAKEDSRVRQKSESAKSSQGVQTPPTSALPGSPSSSKSKSGSSSKQQSPYAHGSTYSPVKTAAVMGIPRNPDAIPSSPGTGDRPKTRVKVCGSTQTTAEPEYIAPSSSSVGKPALSANVRERILANYAQSAAGQAAAAAGMSGTGGTAIMFARRGGSGGGGSSAVAMKTDGSLSDSNYSNYADLMAAKERDYGGPGDGVYSWASRHYSSYSPAAAPFRRFGGSLTEGESMESLSSTASSIAAQIQNARANSLNQTKLLLQQQHQNQNNVPGSPRLNRSSSARSNKSEKIYSGLNSGITTRLSFSNAPGSPVANAAGGAAILHEASQPGSPLPNHKGNYGLTTMSVPPSPYASAGDRQLQQGSLRTDDSHGSALSLISTGSSLYSGQQGTNTSASVAGGADDAVEVRRLKRDLADSQKKIQTLTTQLATNAHVVAAFEQSLSNMTQRLQQLTSTSEEKEQELNELRRTIDQLRKQGADLGMNLPNNLSRQLSTESMSSLSSACSVASHASNASHAHDTASSHNASSSGKKKSSGSGSSSSKKKGWLRSSFSKAFGKGGNAASGGGAVANGTMSAQATPKKSAGASIPEDFSASVPASPMLSAACALNSTTGSAAGVNLSANSSFNDTFGEDSTPRVVLDLKKQLREKDLILTDIRLEALTSAHQLESLKEAVTRMRNEMLSLKQDNERLQRMVASKSLTTSNASLEDREFTDRHRRRSTSETACRESSPCDPPAPQHQALVDLVGEAKEEGQRISISVCRGGSGPSHEGRGCDLGTGAGGKESETEWFIGNIYVSGKTKWEMLDDLVGKIFKEYLFHVDPVGQLGLSEDSVASYRVGEILRDPWDGAHGEGARQKLPELLPCGYLVGDVQNIKLGLRDGAGSVDALAFETLTPKAVIQRYVSLLTEHRRIILCGPSGTGKSYLARKLAEYLVRRSGAPYTPEAIATFSVDEKSAGELQAYLMNLADQCESSPETPGGDLLPRVIILDNLHRAGSLSDVFSGFLNSTHARCPTIIGTMSQTSTANTTNLQLHHNFRWILCANHMEPVSGFLARHLRRRLIESEVRAGSKNPEMARVLDWVARVWAHINKVLETHASSDVTLGPRLFLGCPLDVESSRVWFTDLWNYSIVPYAMNAVREGLQLYGRKGASGQGGSGAPGVSSAGSGGRGWEDPTSWVLQSWPWPRPSTQPQDSLIRIRPEDVGYDPQPDDHRGRHHHPHGHHGRRHSATNTTTTVTAAELTTSTHSAGSLMLMNDENLGMGGGGLQPQDESESDPLVKMLRRLQQAAASASRESDGGDDDCEIDVDSSSAGPNTVETLELLRISSSTTAAAK